MIIHANNYENVFVNDESLTSNNRKVTQYMILDIGCPRSLMGSSEYSKYLSSLSEEDKEKVLEFKTNEKFKFGPSRIFTAKCRVQMPLILKNVRLLVNFFVIDGDIPILIGNDILEPLGGIIRVETKLLELEKIRKKIEMYKSKGGHFVLPVVNRERRTSNEEYIKVNICDIKVIEKDDTSTSENVLGEEADAVMSVLLSECEDRREVMKMHDILGHNNLMTLMLEKDEEDEVKKVHKYFGHKSGRKVWELFSKAGKLKGKKKEVLKLLENCSICKEHKKTPPRPRVGMPVANSFNEVVGLDLKILGDGSNILWMVDMFSRAIKGAHIKDKKPETIVKALHKGWCLFYGYPTV